MLKYSILLSIFLLYSIVNAKLTALVPSEEYTHKHVVDDEHPEQYVLLWKLVEKNEIQFEIHVKTTGWVGFGISPNGGMKGADIAIGWVDKDGKAQLKDCYATDKVKPLIDAKQNLDLLDAAETNGYTILKFKRKIETCDYANDVDIQIGTNFVIFAWNNEDPVTGNNDWVYHRENRFTYSLALRDFKTLSISEQDATLPNVKSIDLRVDNLKIPKKDTFYFCELFKLQPFEEKEHLIQFEMLINKKNKRNVHHLLAYECEDSYVPKTFPWKAECGSVQIDTDISVNCQIKMIVAWGIGGQTKYNFPKEAGYPFVKSDKNKYIFIEMHYDNPDLKEDLIDDSGIRLSFTRNLRDKDLGLLTLGVDGNLGLQVPPKTDVLTVSSICHPECTQKFIPEDGITVVGALLHTHLLGTSVSTSLVRKDIQIGKLSNNPHYDFNYQYIIDIEPTKVYRGDALITKCDYSSKNRTAFTTFGFSTNDEMCFDFMYYYPKIEGLTSCSSFAPPKVYYDFYYSLIKDGLATNELLKPDATDEEFYSLSSEIKKYLKTKAVFNQPLIDRFKKFFSSSHNKTYYCGGPDFSNDLLLQNKPHYEPAKVLTVPSTCSSSSSGLETKYMNYILLFSFILSLLF